MGRLDLGSLRSARTARTYPVGPEELRAVVGRAVERLPRWTLGGSGEDELHAVCESRLFRFKDDLRIRLTPRSEDALEAPPHGVRAEFESASRVGVWDLGQNKRNLRKLLGAVDQELGAKG